MGIFSKRNNDIDELFELIDGKSENDDLKTQNFKSKEFVTHALTPEEIKEDTDEIDFASTGSSNPLNALKKRMKDNSTQSTGISIDNDFDDNEDNIVNNIKKHDIIFETKPANKEVKIEENNNDISLEELIKKSEKISHDAHRAFKSSKEVPKINLHNKGKSLLEKCKPYFVDDDGNNEEEVKPSYTLESVADILKSEGQKTIEKISQKYEITFDDLGKYSDNNKTGVQNDTSKTTNIAEKDVFEDKMTTSFNGENGLPIISDIDNTTLNEEKLKQHSEPEINAGTIRFTPIKDDDFDISHISVSSQTKAIDLTGELTQISKDDKESESPETRLEKTEFQEFSAKEEYVSQSQSKTLLRKFSISKRNSFVKLGFSIIFTVLISLFTTPLISSFLVSSTRTCMIICTVLLLGIIGLNYDAFKSIKNIFKRCSSPDICLSFSTAAVLIYVAYGFYKNEITLNIMLLLAIIQTFRLIGKFIRDSYILSNFKVLLSSSNKRGIKLIEDTATTFAMAKGSIEGDVLIAASQKTDFVNDYMKYSTFGVFLSGKLPVINIITLVLSICLGFASAAYYNSAMRGLYIAAVILCIASIPTLFLIDSLSVYSSSKRLNNKGSAIFGKTGAEHIEMANAVVFSSEDLFPSGTITMHDLKILSTNNVDENIVRAASLTEAIGSPLTTIFKKIAGNSSIVALPDSDTVKYEDRLGISGWVDNKLLFIGNRTLLESHGIDVPDVSLDKKILRSGYFPVYIATDGKPCAIVVVQYSVNPEIAHQLRNITSLGITVLVNNTDPNLSEEMICDYLGLYQESVKVMSSAGCHMLNNAVPKVASMSAPAVYKGNPLGLATLINSATKIKKSNMLLSVFYILSAIVGITIFVYTAFSGGGTVLSDKTVLLYCLACTAISYILFLTQKP